MNIFVSTCLSKMAASKDQCSFSNNGQYFSQVSSDSRLRIWECESGLLQQEYVPVSHLSASCTCICWAPMKRTEQGPSRKKKKWKSTADIDTIGSDVIALGTASGNILLYSVNRAELQHQLSDGHSSRINCLCWNINGTSLFSASENKKVVEWNVSDGAIKRHWKLDNGPVFQITMLQDGIHLLTAGRSINCWDIENQSVVGSFTGHTNNVLQLAVINSPEDKEGYFLSSASGDRNICAWRFIGSGKSNRVLASFSLQDDPIAFNIAAITTKDEPLVITAITVTGLLHIFEHVLNGHCKKPIQPKVTVNIGSDSAGIPKSLPIIGAHPLGAVDGNCHIVYGSTVKPAFEKIYYRKMDTMTCLLRTDPLSIKHNANDHSVLKTRTPNLPLDAKAILPEHMVPTTIAGFSNDAVQSRKRRSELVTSSTKDSLPMEQRLSALNLDKASDAVAPPQADNLAQLLLQGLHSRDAKLLQSVFDRGEVQIITNTVRRIPVQAVVPLLIELTRLLQYRGHPNHSYARWLRSVLEYHAGYLTSCPDLSSFLSPLLTLLSARTALFPKLSQLRGRLDLMLGQLGQRNIKDNQTTAELPAEALLIYQEESSDDGSDEGDWPLQSGSESEDQWDDQSDIAESIDETYEDKESEQEDAEEETENDSDVLENGISD